MNWEYVVCCSVCACVRMCVIESEIEWQWRPQTRGDVLGARGLLVHFSITTDPLCHFNLRAEGRGSPADTHTHTHTCPALLQGESVVGPWVTYKGLWITSVSVKLRSIKSPTTIYTCPPAEIQRAGVRHVLACVQTLEGWGEPLETCYLFRFVIRVG